MPEEKRYRAVVRIVLDIDVDGVWGEGTTVDQVVSQATDGARQRLLNAVSTSKSITKPKIIAAGIEGVTIVNEEL